MTIREIIESGMVEAYVLGLLDDHQRQELEEALQRSPELQAELARVEEALERFAHVHAIEPPPQLREQIWEAITERAAPQSLKQQTPLARPMLSRWNMVIGALAGIAFLLLVVSGIWLWKLSSTLELQGRQFEQFQHHITQSLRALEAQLADVRDYVRLTGGKAVIVPLTGTANQPTARASVCWDTASGQLFLAMPLLPPLPSDKAYQLWALVDGKPIDAGVFVPDSSQLVYRLKEVHTAEAFAVTIEPREGSSVPTLSSMVLMGKIAQPTVRLTERGTR